MARNIHVRFNHFLDVNLHHIDEESGCPVHELYDAFSKLEWVGEDYQSLLKEPDQIPEKAKHFLRLVSQSESEPLPWFIVGRQVQLNDSMFHRCLNLFKSRYLNVTLKNKETVDLNVLDYLNKMNTTQVALRLPKARPCISSHSSRLMRELWLLSKKHNFKYKVRDDDEQLQEILKTWFHSKYTLKCEKGTIGYPRRQLLEEANDFLVRNFGDTKVLYCHAKPWRWFMKNVVGMDDTTPTGNNYLRLPVWKKDSTGQAILNVRNSVGTGGEFSLEKRASNRLTGRRATKRELDCARKARDNKKKKTKRSII